MTTGTHIHIDEIPLGQGVVAWKTALHFIDRDLPEDGYFIYEHIKTAEDARAGVRLLRDLARKAGVAFNGKGP